VSILLLAATGIFRTIFSYKFELNLYLTQIDTQGVDFHCCRPVRVKNIGTRFYYSNSSSSGAPNLVLTFLRVFALAIVNIWFLKWKMRSSVSLGRLDGNPMNCLKELSYEPWKLFCKVLACVSIIGVV
jgi:hypothetical protein